MKKVALAKAKDDLSRYLRQAARWRALGTPSVIRHESEAQYSTVEGSMRQVVLILLIAGCASTDGAPGGSISSPEQQAWAEFVRAMESGPYPTQDIRPYYEVLREPMAGFLEQMSDVTPDLGQVSIGGSVRERPAPGA